MKLFLVAKEFFPSLLDLKAALDLIKEAGGRVAGLAPWNLGFIVETTPEVAKGLDLIYWN